MEEYKGFSITTEIGADISKVTSALNTTLLKNGFRVIKKTDLSKEIMKDISIKWLKYHIWDIIDAEITYKILSINKYGGTFTPIRILIYEKGDNTIISVIDPRLAARLIDNPTIIELAQEMGDRIKNALAEIENKFK
ncbi:MAG TPA: DUF302 domain-containing protein [Firmicutes bacterium]|nr:DUF302 domain-containing protein [Bacillota bacterium]